MSAATVLLAETAFGLATIDPAEEELLELAAGTAPPRPRVEGLGLPLLVAGDAYGSRVVAVVETRPPLLVSDDSGLTWREAGAGLPALVDVAISPDHPDTVAAASATRLYLSEDGGRFWRSLAIELEGVTTIAWSAA